MKIVKAVFAAAVMLIAWCGLAADSTAFKLDTVTPVTSPVVDSLPVNWDAEWIGGAEDATVLITDNEAELGWFYGDGEFTWVPETSGDHELKYVTYIDGVAQDEVYTVMLRSDWGSASSMFEWIVVSNEVIITKTLAEEIKAKVGQKVTLYVGDDLEHYIIKTIVDDEGIFSNKTALIQRDYLFKNHSESLRCLQSQRLYPLGHLRLQPL